MRKISKRVMDILSIDPFMKRCCIRGMCEGKIDWHHVWTYASRQIDEVWAIVPACKYHHDKAENPQIKAKFQLISLSRASPEDLQKYPKKDWQQIIKYLNTTNGKER